MRGTPGFRSGFVFGGSGFHNGRFFPHHHNRFFFGGCFGSPFCGGAFFNSGWVASPIFWPSYDYSYAAYAPAYAAPAYAAPAYDTTGLEVQIQRLTDEVEELRREQQERSRPAPSPEAQSSRLSPAAVFLLKDGRRIETRNYGIAGQTLWLLTERHARLVPLGQVDIDATNQLNQERGIDLVLPTAR